ncbi:hypothetical protein [uncultured Lacinutrix sp.]|uniref:hypothetical protein n=1 Tax=uncultured Lacinutrix sp. TaxID=574032 RepID=UPI00262F5489|nr:hypothetical protein [uncultured Lacinutrix sp.]
MKRPKRRHNTSFSYTGAGNKASVFNRKPRAVFSESKNKLNNKSLSKYKLEFNNKSLSKIERKYIKDKIRSENRKKNITVIIFSFLLLIPIILVLQAIIEGALSNLKF